jgi:monoterpene epsilon-lactone hydrolase
MASEITEQIKQIMRSLPLNAGSRPIEEQRAAAEMVWPLLTAEVEGATYEPMQIGHIPAEEIGIPGAKAGMHLLYLHGGGYCLGSIATHRKLAAHICKAAKSDGLIVDYRLAPENPFPAGLDDAVEAFGWLAANRAPADRIMVVGDSAGGGLALSLALRLRDEGRPGPGALVLLSPWTDLALTGDSIISKKDVDLVVKIEDSDDDAARAYIGTSGADLKDPLVSPLYAELAGLPRMLIQVGEEEVLLDDSTRLAQRAEDEGVAVTLQIWPEMFHVFQMGAGFLPESNEAMALLADWVVDWIGE